MTAIGSPAAALDQITRQWDGDVKLMPREGGGLRAVIEVGR